MLKFVYLSCKMWAQKLYLKYREVTINVKKKRELKLINAVEKTLTNQRHLTLFPAGTIVRNSHHLRRHRQDLNLDLSQALLNEVVQ